MNFYGCLKVLVYSFDFGIWVVGVIWMCVLFVIMLSCLNVLLMVESKELRCGW